MIRELQYNHIFDAQKHFRVLLDTMARPGKINRLTGDPIDPPKGLYKASAWIGFALLDAQVNFYSPDQTGSIQSYFTVNTSAQQATVEEASFLFFSGTHETDLISRSFTGEPEYPDQGATLIIQVDALSDEPLLGGLPMTLKGPGIDGSCTVYTRGLDSSILADIKEQNTGYPLGVDTILVDPEDQIMGLPRTVKLNWH